MYVCLCVFTHTQIIKACCKSNGSNILPFYPQTCRYAAGYHKLPEGGHDNFYPSTYTHTNVKNL